MSKCERCSKDTNVTTCSMFNIQTICMACKEKEAEHPEYEVAREAESRAVRRGDYNFRGVGLPADLERSE